MTGESKWKHPLLPYYKGAVFMDQGGAAETQNTNLRSPCSDQEVRAPVMTFRLLNQCNLGREL